MEDLIMREKSHMKHLSRKEKRLYVMLKKAGERSGNTRANEAAAQAVLQRHAAKGRHKIR